MDDFNRRQQKKIVDLCNEGETMPRALERVAHEMRPEYFKILRESGLATSYTAPVDAEILDEALEIPGVREALEPKVQEAKEEYKKWKNRRIDQERGGVEFTE